MTLAKARYVDRLHSPASHSERSCGGVGSELPPPVGVAGCHKCGLREQGADGRWRIGLDRDGRPVCEDHR